MSFPVILISGKNGQLGKELQQIAPNHNNFNFIFFDKDELNIENDESIKNAFEKYQPSFFINCAAYTAVDKAQTEQEISYNINAKAVGTIAKCCYQHQTKLIHVSTDYVFDGKGATPYKEDDTTNTVNFYGHTKWLGEQLALHNNPASIIIRTSWVYSEFGNNFVKTMLRLMKERKDINVVADQLGSPTYAKDLAEVILQIVNRKQLSVNEESANEQPTTNSLSGIYHFSNDGIISWFDFATAIKEIKQFDCNVHPIPTSAYPTPAKRPGYSALDKFKIVNTFNIELKDWKESLKECLKKL